MRKQTSSSEHFPMGRNSTCKLQLDIDNISYMLSPSRSSTTPQILAPPPPLAPLPSPLPYQLSKLYYMKGNNRISKACIEYLGKRLKRSQRSSVEKNGKLENDLLGIPRDEGERIEEILEPRFQHFRSHRV